MGKTRFRLYADKLWGRIHFEGEAGKKAAIQSLAEELRAECGPVCIGRFNVGYVTGVEVVEDGLAVEGEIKWNTDKISLLGLNNKGKWTP